MENKKIKHAEVTSAGLLVGFEDGREGLIAERDLRECVEKTDGFAKVEELQVETEDDLDA